MASTFYGLEIAKSALFNSRTNMDIANHNMANADSIGYTRQRLVSSAIPPQIGKTFLAQNQKTTAGAGVKMEYITQIRDMFLDAQYRKESAQTEYLNTKADDFSWIGAMFKNELDPNDSTTSINLAMGSFSSAFAKLAESPSSMEYRKGLVSSASMLTKTVDYYYGKLKDQYDGMDTTIQNGVDRINTIANELSQLNGMIYEYEMNGAKANDLRDVRNLLLDELSGLAEISYKENDGNNFEVSIGGQTLVKGSSELNKLVTAKTEPGKLPDPQRPSTDPDTFLKNVYWADANGEPILLDPNDPTSVDPDTMVDFGMGKGSIQASLDMRDGDTADNKGIPYIVNQLNVLVRKFVQDFNELSVTGWTLPGEDGSPSHQGEYFFTVVDNGGGEWGMGNPGDTTANIGNMNVSNFKLNQNILDDPRKIAVASQPLLGNEPNDQASNFEIGKRMAELFTKKDASGVADNVNSVFKGLVGDISFKFEELVKQSKAQNIRLGQVEYQRMAISSVSQDEEMINVIKYSKAFNAAARMISTIDEQLDVLINKMGIVGR